MLAFDLFRLIDSRVTPQNVKVHLASSDGEEDPLQVHLEARFDEWQSWQSQKIFERELVVSFIKLGERDRWLYVGAFTSEGIIEPAPESRYKSKYKYKYNLSRLPTCDEFAGRLVVSYERPSRKSCLYGETCENSMVVHEIRAEPIRLEDFPGFKKVHLPFSDLDTIVRQNTASWRAALSSVAGVYLISDPDSGKLYVGSATGEGGIWARWCQYVDGHGNNVELRKVITEFGAERAKSFRFSVLEIADTHASAQEVLERESHWKRVLLTRSHGYNAN